MNKLPISVVVLTKNEEDRIAKCLDTVHDWVDEIIIIDDESTDNTVEIAKKYTDRIINKKMEIEGRHRNWAYSQAKNKWVLSLDADEYVTDELKEEITETLLNTNYCVFTIPRRNYIGDYWIKYGGLYPSAQLKLFKKGSFEFKEDEVHPGVSFNCKKEERSTLKKDIIHKSYRNFEHFVSKLNNQTTLEAKKWIRTNRKMTFGKAFWRTIDRFPRTYIGKKGYKDKFIGFMIAFFASFYQLISYSKYWEMKKNKN